MSFSSVNTSQHEQQQRRIENLDTFGKMVVKIQASGNKALKFRD
jgi:hypothetical protein